MIISMISLYGAFINPKVLEAGRRGKRFVEAFGLKATRIIVGIFGLLALPISLGILLGLLELS